MLTFFVKLLEAKEFFTIFANAEMKDLLLRTSTEVR